MEAIHCAVIAESLQSGAEVCVPREAPYDICIDGIEEFPLPSQQCDAPAGAELGSLAGFAGVCEEQCFEPLHACTRSWDRRPELVVPRVAAARA